MLNPPLHAPQVPNAADASGATTLQPDPGSTQHTAAAHAVSHEAIDLPGMLLLPCSDQKVSNPRGTHQSPESHCMSETITKRGPDGATGIVQKHVDTARYMPILRVGNDQTLQQKQIAPCATVCKSRRVSPSSQLGWGQHR